MQVLMFLVLVLGVGTEAPRRYSTIIASVKSSFLRRSGVRNADAKALSTGPPTQGEERRHPAVMRLTSRRWNGTRSGPSVPTRPRTRKSYSLLAEPPAAAIFSRAEPENALA